MYDRRIKGKDLTLGVSGKLHANSLIMYDHQTDSLWSHLVGAAVTGPMKGEKLKPLPSMFTKWDTWKTLHPKSKVLSTGRSGLFVSMRDPYASYYHSSDTGIVPTRLSDKRIYPKEYVLGMVFNNKAKAYPFSILSRQTVINDTFQDSAFLIVFDTESTTGVIFSRYLDAKILNFKALKQSGSKNLLLADDATASVWDGFTGESLQGTHKGKKLEAIPMTPSFWFGWVDHYPTTELYGINK